MTGCAAKICRAIGHEMLKQGRLYGRRCERGFALLLELPGCLLQPCSPTRAVSPHPRTCLPTFVSFVPPRSCRDIKPQNLLVNINTHALKLCDFGSAKALIRCAGRARPGAVGQEVQGQGAPILSGCIVCSSLLGWLSCIGVPGHTCAWG